MPKTKERKIAKLPSGAALKRRDMREVYAREAERFVRCPCGHLKYDGYVCNNCGEEMGLLHPLIPHPA